MALTRRNFVRAAGLAGAAGSVALLAGCARGAADSGANEPVAAGAAGAGVGPDGVSQVVITMTPSSEPPPASIRSWGGGPASTCTSRSSNRRSSPRTNNLGLRERSRHRLRLLRGRPHLDVPYPRGRDVHRRRAAHGRGRGLHHQRNRERRSGRSGSVHGGRGAGR